MHRVNLRLMDERDLHSTERVSADLFYEADRLTRRMNEPEIERRSASISAQWIERMRFFLSVDPEGCWVADDGEDIVGFAISQNRGAFWYLATYGVSTGRQGQGIGRRLMDAALTHAAGRQGMFSSSVHPGATRRYRLAGFTLMPQMRMVGTVDRSTLPTVTGLREGTENDVAWMDLLDE